jgi:hypothetical protein
MKDKDFFVRNETRIVKAQGKRGSHLHDSTSFSPEGDTGT